MQVKSAKAVTEVTLSLTGEDAELLNYIVKNCVEWNNSLIGTFAEELSDALDQAEVPVAGEWVSE